MWLLYQIIHFLKTFPHNIVHFPCVKVLRNLCPESAWNKNIPADNSKSSMGIGLSVCAAIISAHGSKIYAKRKEKGGMLFGFGLELGGEQDE